MSIKEASLEPNLLEATQAKKEKYQEITGSLIFSMVEIRPDIAFSIAVATHFTKNPKHAYIKVVKIIFWYLKSSIDRSIIYKNKRKTFSIKGYSDSN